MGNEANNEKIKSLESEFITAMKRLIEEKGSQKNLSEITGIHQSRISGYLNGTFDFNNLSIGTLIKLFPQLQISYFDTANATADTSSEIFDMLEKRLLKMFRRLNAEDKILAFEKMSRTFGDKY